MRDQRRLLAARALRRDPGGARRRPALPALARLAPARLLPQLRARAGAGARRGDATSRSPTRTTAGTPTSSRRCWPSSATPSSSTATRASSTATAACSPTPTGAGAATTTATCSRCWWRTRSPAPPRCSRRRCCDDALPFPPAQFAHFHDHWLALVALSLGDIAFVERPLVRLRPARRRDARARRRQPHAGDARAARGGAPRPARADPAVADALLRRRLPAAAVHGDPAAAAVAADGAGQAPRARALRARRPLARRAGGADLAGRAGAAGPAPRHARRRVDARPRLRLAAAADGERPRRADPLRAPRLAAAARLRPAARRPRARRAGRARDRREDRAAAAGGERRRAAAGQPAHPLDRPPALLRGLHRQVQPRAPAGGARRAGADRHRRPRRLAAGELAARRRGLQRARRDARRGRGGRSGASRRGSR